MSGLRLQTAGAPRTMENTVDMEHPGTIVYVDGNTNRTLTTKKIADVPERFRFADGPGGKKLPIVRVVATVVGNMRTINEYGTEGQLLRTTRQAKV